MKYDVKHIKKESYFVSNWSGGKTTELYIYPEGSSYIKRDFFWRLSSATVEVEKSTFTVLPKIKRQLMIIEGKTKLVHNKRYEITLNPFEKDSFMGDWGTVSYGKASDFNLMTSEACTGNLDVIEVSHKTNIELNTLAKEKNKITEAFFLINGEVQFIIGENKLELSEKDLLLIDDLKSKEKVEAQIINKGKDNVKIIKATIICK